MPITFSKKEHPYDHWEMLNIDNGDYLRIAPERGGIITEWFCNGKEILYFDLDRFVQERKSIRGGIPILFPICGDLQANTLKVKNSTFHLNQHGFARDMPWKLEPLVDQASFRLSLSENAKTLEVYPFYFLMEIEVKLILNSLEFAVTIYNSSKDKMPFSFGFHPYFNVLDIKRVKIKGLPQLALNYLNNKKVDTSNLLEELSHGVDFMTGPSEITTLIDCVAQRQIQIQYQEPLDLTVVWTDPPRKMVCMEPWTSPRGSLQTGERQLSIDPGEKMKLHCRFIAM